ncbi:hypothetical protein D9611_007898 [Ephemerocybe angulata]|uniref:G domain-containing protein n=1 Tax=Ephemerocybe angulata TaxID=980116 RepID=A0A8H5CFB6_9AGAR|nr:hypothetical protein D9611_007898 [Tulosesus angulatus]
MGEHTIAVLGRFDSGKTTFIKAVQKAATATSGPHAAEETPTLGIAHYDVTFPDGRSFTFLDTPGFDGYQAGGEPAKETEEILQMLEEHLAANGSRPVSHVLFFLSANDMNGTRFKPRAQRAFERLFPNAQVTCITSRWDQVENDDGCPLTAEEAQSREEDLYASGKTSGGLLEYLLDGRQNRGDDVRRFRSGIPNEAYSSPQDIIRELFAGPGSTAAGDAAPGPQEAVRTPRTRRQRLLDTIHKFSAQVLEMVAELDREALDVEDECKTKRAEVEAAAAAIKEAEDRLAETKEDMKAAEDECTRLTQERDSLAELEQSLTTQLNGLATTTDRRSLKVKQRITTSLSQTQGFRKERESWISVAEEEYQKGVQEVEQTAAEIEKWRLIELGKERELNEWLSPESEWLSKERESFRTLQGTLSTNLDAMREGLKDTWQGKLGENVVFLEHLGGYAVDPEMVAHSGAWAPVIESFYESQVTLGLLKDLTQFHSAVLQRLKAQEETAQREWKQGVEDNFGLGALFKDLAPPPPPLTGHTGPVWSVAFSWDGRRIVSGSEDKTVRVWNALTGEVQNVLEGHSNNVTSVAFSPNGKDIVSGSYDTTVRVWDAVAGKVKKVLEGHSKLVRSVDFSADGTRVVSGSNDGTVRIWDVSTGESQHVLKGHTNDVCSAVFSADGSKVFSGSDDKSVRVWDALTGDVCAVLEGHETFVTAVASSRDGLRVGSGSWDKAVRVWDALTGEALRVLEGHGNYVWSVSFSKHGFICSGSADKTVRVWSGSAGTAQSVLEGHSDVVRSVAFSRDGRRIVSASCDKTIRVWNMTPLTNT